MRQKFESGEGFRFEEFLDLLDQMRKPFVSEIEGHEVSLTQDDCAIMMETSALRAITQTLFVEKEKCCENSNSNQQQQNKRQRTTNNGNQTVRTECGANGIMALQQTAQRNNRLKQQELKTARGKLNRESKAISMTLTLLAALKQKKPDAYWVFSFASSQQEMMIILQLFAPDSGMISKGKQQQWHLIEENLAPMLFQVAVDAKGEEYTWQLATIATELAALAEQEQDLENSSDNPTEDHNMTADDCNEPDGQPAPGGVLTPTKS